MSLSMHTIYQNCGFTCNFEINQHSSHPKLPGGIHVLTSHVVLGVQQVRFSGNW